MFRLKRLSCSFCHRKESEVAKLVACGGRLREVFICDQCVAIASDIMRSHDEGVSQPSIRTGWFRRLFTGHLAAHQPLSHKRQEPAGVMS